MEQVILSMSVKELERERMLTEIITERDTVVLDFSRQITTLKTTNKDMVQRLEAAELKVKELMPPGAELKKEEGDVPV